ncbi:MAG: HlyD family type I secretion periplasmic adaptor subunit [Pseudomonadota bacterium]
MTLRNPVEELWESQVPRSTGSLVALGVLVIGLVLGGFGAWSFTAPIEGATVASGNFVATGRNMIVQHPDGGVIQAIHVAEGDRVAADSVLVHLENPAQSAELDRLRSREFRLTARAARLRAEIAGDAAPDLGPAARSAEPDRHRRTVLELQRSLFHARRDRLDSEVDILRQGIAAYRQHVSGAEKQLAAAETQLALISEELADSEILISKGLAKRPAFLAIQRSQAQLNGEVARLRAHIGDSLERIVRGEQLIIKANHTAKEDALAELETTEAELRDVWAQISAVSRAVERLQVRAPADGIVVRLDFNANGGVVPPGGTILEMVPLTDQLEIEARMRPEDVETVHRGQPALVRLTAFNQRTTPTVRGEVVYVSADTLEDDTRHAGRDAYIVRVRLDPDALSDTLRAMLQPGMPAEVFLLTGARTFADYLIQPITDSMSHAFREH